MINIATIQVGEKVCYQPEYYKNSDTFENGIVKEVPEGSFTQVRVVYHCAGDWSNYKDYTGQLTNVKDLYRGWKHKEIKENLEEH